MSNIPNVSIVIPTHNRPELLKRALDSVYAQTYTDFEVIVVDDGDAPRAHDVLSGYRSRPNFVYLETEKDTGGSATRNVGIGHARGEYVAFLDDDDEWLPKKLETQIPLLKEASAKVGFVFCAVHNIHLDGRVETTPVNPDTRDYSTIALIRFNGFMTSGLIVRKTVFDDVGMFDESLPSHQEADLILRIAQKYEGIGLKEAYVNMRVSSLDDHIGGNIGRRIAGREMVLAKHTDIFLHHPDLCARHYFWLALRYREDGQYKKYVEACRTSLKHHWTLTVFGHYLRGLAMRGIWSLKSVFSQTKL
jgi:glycosyltransferase involved in cell wall biosynthesis